MPGAGGGPVPGVLICQGRTDEELEGRKAEGV
jgi:hypothetical protein